MLYLVGRIFKNFIKQLNRHYFSLLDHLVASSDPDMFEDGGRVFLSAFLSPIFSRGRYLNDYNGPIERDQKKRQGKIH